MVQQARLMAAGLAGNETLTADSVSGLLTALGEQADARIRIIWRVLGRGGTRAPSELSSAILSEVRDALAGRYGAATRATPGQRSLTLSSAVPVKHGGRVTGAVVVSQSTYRILQALYEVRLRLFEIVLLSMAVAAVLTLDRLVHDRESDRAAATGWRRRWRPRGSELVRRIWPNRTEKMKSGILPRSLEELAGRLDAHIKLLESVAADVTHEFQATRWPRYEQRQRRCSECGRPRGACSDSIACCCGTWIASNALVVRRAGAGATSTQRFHQNDARAWRSDGAAEERWLRDDSWFSEPHVNLS